MSLNFNKLLASLVVLPALLAAPQAFSADYWSPRTTGLGGSGHAAPLLNDAIYLNPSFASFLPSYSASFNYDFFNAGNQNTNGDWDVHGHDMNLSIQDGRSEMFQAGVGITQTDNYRLIDVGASKAVIQRLGVGLGAKFLFPSTGSRTSVQDGILSVSGVATEWFLASFIIDNLIESDAAKAHNLYREFTLGTKFNIMKILLIYIDPHFAPDLPDALSSDNSTFGYNAAAEITVMSDFFLRMGLYKNSYVPFEAQRGDGFSLGFGWVGPRMSLDYGMTHATTPTTGIMHNFGITIYI